MTSATLPITTTPYWWEAAPPEHGLPADALGDCDVAIIGSGYTGLSAAITLAEAGVTRVAVIDRQRLGEGASSRNGGQLGAESKVDAARLEKRYGPEVAREVEADFRAAMPFFLERFATLSGECHLQMTGSVVGAHCTADYRDMVAAVETLPAAERGRYRLVPPEQMHREIKTDIYRGALVRDEGGLIHPALYHRALRERARALGIALHSGVDVTGVTREGQGFRLHLGGGRAIRARQVIMGPNGYAGPALPWLRRRLVPVASYMIATAPLPAAQMRELIPGNRAVADTKKVLYYYRLSPDGQRMLFGGRASFTAVDEQRSAVGLRGFMRSVFPELADVAITHSWLGNVAFCLDFLPHYGVHDGIHFAGGCNGSGIVMSTYLGHKVAERVLDGGKPARGLGRIPYPAVPGYTGNPWFLGIVGNLYRAGDILARWRDRA